MRLTDFSLQKLAQSKYKGEIYFSNYEEGAGVLSRKYPYVKMLLLLSINTADKFTLFQQLFPQATVCVLLPQEGVEKLFALPDDLALVLCYGEDYAVQAARYFASVRALPCAVFVRNAQAKPLCMPEVEVCIGGQKSQSIAKHPEFLFIDDALWDKDSFLPAYVNVLSARTALFEAKFNELILQTLYDRDCSQTVESAIAACAQTPFPFLEKRQIFCASLLICLCAQSGFSLGELGILTSTYERLGAGSLAGFYAMEKLAKTYQVFFKYGNYRKYYTPPYHARIRQASGLYKKSEEELDSQQILPSVETLSLYAQVYETVRAQFLCEAQELLRRLEWLEDNVKEYKAAFPMENRLLNAALKYLPEGNPHYGLTSLMRDFGLLDF